MYPPYSLLSVLPMVFLPFEWASTLWMALNLAVLFLIIAFFPAWSRPLMLSALLFFPIIFDLFIGPFDILVAAGLLLFFGTLHGQKRAGTAFQVVVGVLVAWATIKPQFAGLILGFALLVAIREKYGAFLKSFFVSLVCFLLFSFFYVPTWVFDWIGSIRDYTQYIHTHFTILDFYNLVFSPGLASFLSVVSLALASIAALALLVRWWQGKNHWIHVLAWLGMMTYLFHMHGTSYEQIIFFIPLMIWASLSDSWKSPGVLAFWVATLVISWLALILGYHQDLAIDRSPVLFNPFWVFWILRKPDPFSVSARLPAAPSPAGMAS